MESRNAIGAAAGKRAFLFPFYLRKVVHDAFTNEENFLDRAHICSEQFSISPSEVYFLCESNKTPLQT